MKQASRVWLVKPDGSERELKSLSWPTRRSVNVPIKHIHTTTTTLKVHFADEIICVAEFNNESDLKDWLSKRLAWAGQLIYSTRNGVVVNKTIHNPRVTRSSIYASRDD